jgi:DCN1-like protein 3
VRNRIKFSRRFSDTPNTACGIDEEGQGDGLLETQLYSNVEPTTQSAPVHPALSMKFDGMVVKDPASSSAIPGRRETTVSASSSSTSNPPSKEKKSLALKLSGTLNRNNSESRTFSESKIQQLFEKYKDEGEDAILSEGVEQLCIDLQLKPDEFKVLVLAWKFEAEVMCRFTSQEFLAGCKALKVDTVKGIQGKLPEVAASTLNDISLFKELYRFTFKFGLDLSTGQRILPVDMAVSLWLLVFSQQEPPILKRWVYFLEKHPQVRGIPRDTWFMFLHFVQSVGNDLTQYDDTEAWPSLFDDFVEFENDQLNQNSSAMLDLNRESSLTPSGT